MKIGSVVETTFSGAHTVTSHPLCGERHGHTWRVRVELAAEEEGLVAGSPPAIRDLIAQYHRRDLDRYLPAVSTTCAGLAVYFRERLADYPISAIEIIT